MRRAFDRGFIISNSIKFTCWPGRLAAACWPSAEDLQGGHQLHCKTLHICVISNSKLCRFLWSRRCISQMHPCSTLSPQPKLGGINKGDSNSTTLAEGPCAYLDVSSAQQALIRPAQRSSECRVQSVAGGARPQQDCSSSTGPGQPSTRPSCTRPR